MAGWLLHVEVEGPGKWELARPKLRAEGLRAGRRLLRELGGRPPCVWESDHKINVIVEMKQSP